MPVRFLFILNQSHIRCIFEFLNILKHILVLLVLAHCLVDFSSCKKDKITTSKGANIQLSQDSVLFDTVFTAIGSSTRNIRIRNKNDQRIRISSIELKGGSSSQFIINVDGLKGTSFKDIEIAAHDSMYVFIQVNVNPTNVNSPVIINDEITLVTNGNTQKLILEAWGQDAYYHRPTSAIKFKDNSYLPYSLVSELPESYTKIGTEYVWKNDKPHVIYGYLVVDSLQRLRMLAGTKVYLNYKAGLWVYRYGQLRVLGTKGNEVTFQGARREKDYADEPGQWDRIWINEGSDNNEITYAIIKNAYIGIQTDIFGDVIGGPGKLKLTNTRIQNMSKWGLYCLGYKVEGGNNVIVNCQEYCLNILLGGEYNFKHCTFANFWAKDKPRDKACINLNNHTETNVFPDSVYFGNCIIDGKLANEITLDLKADVQYPPRYLFSNCWLKTTANVSTVNYTGVRTGTSSLVYKNIDTYEFLPGADETRNKGFDSNNARADVLKFPRDLNDIQRVQQTPTAGAYEFQ